jgi:hypothetical protein
VGGINAAFYLWPKVTEQRRFFLESLLMERQLTEKRNDDTFDRTFGNLLMAMSMPADPGHSYQDDFIHLSLHAFDPALKQAARDYVFNIRLAQQTRQKDTNLS